MEVKTSIKDFKKFCNEFLETQCENEITNFTVLTGHYISGAARSKGEEYFSAYIRCLAYANQNNDIIENEIRFMYYLNNDKQLKYLDIKNLSVYNIKCKKVKDKNLYYILNVKNVKDKRFDKIIQEQLKPITITVNDVLFTFDRRFSQYEGKYVVEDKKIEVSLQPNRNSIDADNSIETFKKINENFISFYENILKKCSKDIVELANEWNDDDECDHEITEQEIFERINKNNIFIEIREKKFTIYMDDDDLFFGHSIVYYGNIENDEFSVDIAG